MSPIRWFLPLSLSAGCSGDDPFKDLPSPPDTAGEDTAGEDTAGEDTAAPGPELDGQWSGACEPQLGSNTSSTTTLDRLDLDLDLIDDGGVVSGVGGVEFVYLYTSTSTSYPYPIAVDGTSDGTDVELVVTFDLTSTDPEWVLELTLSEASLDGTLTVEGIYLWSCSLARI
ncbi:MAG TPA: hypothetical protein ENK18_22370 [Deltaproteobacteria bacterium]|nr:hypothetical protein [Deltaproteobacteria bacterium]